MRRIDSTITIARPVPDVFGYFLDLDRHVADTDPRVESVTKEPVGPARPGTTFRFHQRAFGNVRETSTRFTALEPNRRIAFEGQVGPLRPKGVFTFTKADGGTTLNLRIDDTHPLAPLQPLAPLFARIGQKIWDDRLTRIRTVLEASRQPAQTHPLAIRRWYDHVLADGSVRSRTVAVPGRGRIRGARYRRFPKGSWRSTSCRSRWPTVSRRRYEGPPARAYAMPEGHNVEYDAAGQLVGMTLVNVRWLLERDGQLTITWPAGHVQADELAPALASAA
jgi:Polyketide cyclase / dehydrase and lipid transport